MGYLGICLSWLVSKAQIGVHMVKMGTLISEGWKVVKRKDSWKNEEAEPAAIARSQICMRARKDRTNAAENYLNNIHKRQEFPEKKKKKMETSEIKRRRCGFKWNSVSNWGRQRDSERKKEERHKGREGRRERKTGIVAKRREISEVRTKVIKNMCTKMSWWNPLYIIY